MFDNKSFSPYYNFGKDVPIMPRDQIAKALKFKRKESGLHIDSVSHLLMEYGIKISSKTIYNYETGFRQPDADTLMALCNIYKIDDILGTFGYKRNQLANDSEQETVNGEVQLIKNYRDLNDEGQEKLLDTSDDMVQSGKYKKLGEDIPSK